MGPTGRLLSPPSPDPNIRILSLHRTGAQLSTKRDEASMEGEHLQGGVPFPATSMKFGR